MKTINATGDHQPPTDPYAAYKTQYETLMRRVLDGLRCSARLGSRN